MQHLNMFLYERCLDYKVNLPDIPSYFVEQYGQCAEDIIIVSLLSAYRQNGGKVTGRQYLEIGGNHPIATSATFLLNKVLGINGVIVEANPRLIPTLEQVRRDDLVIHGAVQDQDISHVTLSVSNFSELSSLDRSFVQQWDGGKVGEREQIEVPALRINRLIEEHFGGLPPIYLSIDIEGLDLVVIKDLDLTSMRPEIIQIEPSDHHIPENSVAIISYLKSKGYALASSTNVNLIFIDAFALLAPGLERSHEESKKHPDLPHPPNLAGLSEMICLSEVKDALRKSQAQLDDTQRELERLRTQYTRTQDARASLDLELATTRSERDNSLRQLTDAHGKLKAIKKRLSWKLMSPLRKLGL